MGGQSLAALRDFSVSGPQRNCEGPSSDADFQLVQFDQVIELVVLPFAAAHLGDRMGGLKLAFPGLWQSTAQAAAAQLRGPAMEAMEVSCPCHEHLQVVTVLV
jgi:hypothetical protein